MINGKKGIGQLIVLAILFLVSGIVAMVALNVKGYVPDEALGQNQVRLLELKEDAISALSRADHAVKYASTKSVFDLMKDSLIKNPDCGYHINPLFTDECNYDREIYEIYLQENYDYYTKNKEFVPSYEFKVEEGLKTKIIATPKENLRVYERQPVIISGSVDLFETWPSNSINLSSCYGEDNNIKISGFIENPKDEQAEVYAVADGRIHSICINECNTLSDNSCQDTCDGFGTNIVISHTQGSVTRYSNLDFKSINLQEGAEVKEGQLIAKAGNTGYTNEQQLTFTLYPSLADLQREDSELSPICFFTNQALKNIDYKDTAKSCQDKYPDGFNASNPPQILISECQNLPIGSINEAVLGENGAKVLEKSVKYNEIISLAASEYQIPEALLKSVITIESTFDPNARSPKGPVGIMQMARATATQYGLKAVVCCNSEQVDAGTCNLNTQMCTADNDERFIPEKAIPAGAHLISDLYHRYGKNIYLAALGYHSGQGAADNVHKACPNLDPTNVDKCAADIQRDNPDSSTEAVVDYVKKLEIYYPAWGGLFSSSVSFGSYYEVNPYMEAEIDFDIERFDRLQEVVDNLKRNCDGSVDIENCVSDTVDEINDDVGGIIKDPKMCIPELMTDSLKDYADKIITFIQQYENCKNYDWEELNVTDGCDCEIDFPDIDGLDIRMMPDRIQFIAESKLLGLKKPKVIYEHFTAPSRNFYEFEEGNRKIFGEGVYIYDDRGFIRGGKKILSESGQELIDADGKGSFISREKNELVAKKYDNACEAQIRTYSFCYDTGYKLSGYNSASKQYEIDTEIIIPFSVKIE